MAVGSEAFRDGKGSLGFVEEMEWGVYPKETWVRGKEKEAKRVSHLEKSVSVRYWKVDEKPHSHLDEVRK